jgi:hypothetical protein
VTTSANTFHFSHHLTAHEGQTYKRLLLVHESKHKPREGTFFWFGHATILQTYINHSCSDQRCGHETFIHRGIDGLTYMHWMWYFVLAQVDT